MDFHILPLDPNSVTFHPIWFIPEGRMATELLTEKYRDALEGLLHCYDRVVLTGSIQPWCYAQGMTGYSRSRATGAIRSQRPSLRPSHGAMARRPALAQEAG